MIGLTKNGVQCKLCLERGDLCDLHLDQASASSPRRRSSSRSKMRERSRRSIYKESRSNSTRGGSKRDLVFGVTDKGEACRRCLAKGDFCSQHEGQRPTKCTLIEPKEKWEDGHVSRRRPRSPTLQEEQIRTGSYSRRSPTSQEGQIRTGSLSRRSSLRKLDRSSRSRDTPFSPTSPRNAFDWTRSVKELQEKGRRIYEAKDYKGAIFKFSEALELLESDSCRDDCKLLTTKALLFSYRAACFLMVGATKASLQDCASGLEQLPGSVVMLDAYTLRPKLYCRMAKVLLHLGETAAAEQSLGHAAQAIECGMSFLLLPGSIVEHNMEEEKSKMLLVQEDLKKTANKLKNLSRHLKQKDAAVSEKDELAQINCALRIAPSCESLQQERMTLLISLRRWREITVRFSRLAAANTLMDGCFPDSLQKFNPFPNNPRCKILKFDFFHGHSSKTKEGFLHQLPAAALADVIVRLPHWAHESFVKALRLEERFGAAQNCIQALKKHKVFSRKHASWITAEEQKLASMVYFWGRGKQSFQQKRFPETAAVLIQCLSLDGDIGGTIQAMMQMLVGICHEETNQHEEAAQRYSLALQNHPKYMKARRKRAAVYAKLRRYKEAIADLHEWIRLFYECRRGRPIPEQSSCFFSTPEQATDQEKAEVLNEFDDYVRVSTDYYYGGAPEEEKPSDRQRSKQSNSNTRDSSSNRKKSRHTRSSLPTSNSVRDVHCETLGVPNDATKDIIRKAYLKQVLRYHPDKNDEPNAADMFRRVQEAWEALVSA